MPGTGYIASTGNSLQNGIQNNLPLSVPAGTVDGDQLVAFVHESDADAGVGAPAGWNYTGALFTDAIQMFDRIASSEPASYDWTYGSASGQLGMMATYRGNAIIAVEWLRNQKVPPVGTDTSGSLTNTKAAGATPGGPGVVFYVGNTGFLSVTDASANGFSGTPGTIRQTIYQHDTGTPQRVSDGMFFADDLIGAEAGEDAWSWTVTFEPAPANPFGTGLQIAQTLNMSAPATTGPGFGFEDSTPAFVSL
jgi:hypothetical protein